MTLVAYGLKRSKLQYISLFAHFLAGSLGSPLVQVSLNPDILRSKVARFASRPLYPLWKSRGIHRG